MGLWAWTVNQLLSPKFIKSFRKEGFIRTYTRGHRAGRSAHEVGGRRDLVKCVGQDQFGNMYYEDFDVDSRNQRRWVEYADYFLPIGITGDRIPPGWHGWMTGQFDDTPPEETLVRHHYLKPHTSSLTYTPRHLVNPGSPINPSRMAFIMAMKARKGSSFNLPAPGAKTIGKKIIVERKPYFDDPTAEL